MKDGLLEVGDEIYSQVRDRGRGIVGKVDRVTKTMAFIGKARFRIKVKDNTMGNIWIDKVGSDLYSTISYLLLTEDVRQGIIKERSRANKQSRAAMLIKSVDNISDSNLDKILAILKETPVVK